MSPRIVKVVYYKELHDALRDRRTIFATVIVPLLLYPIMLLGLAEVTQFARAKLDREVYTVAIPAGTKGLFDKISQAGTVAKKKEAAATIDDDDDLIGGRSTPKPALPSSLQGLDKAPPLKFVEKTEPDAEKELASGDIRAIVILPPEPRIQINEPLPLEIKFDRAEQRSRDACERLEKMVEDYEKTVMRERLASRMLNPSFLRAFKLIKHDVSPPSKLGGSVLGSFLPLLFIMMLITGAIYPAIDMTAGEKERSTLETLISSPARPIEIISGKFLAVATIALANAALNVGSFGGTFSVLPAAQMSGFQFPWAALPLTLLLLLPLALFFSGLLLAVSSFAANHKEAQVYCLPIYLVPVLGMMVVMMPGIELDGPLLLLPVVNTALMIKELFLSHGTAQQIMFVFLSTCFYAAGTVALAARIFAREEVLFSAQGSLRLFLNRRFFRPSAEPGAGDSLLLIALLFPLNFYFQLTLTRLLLDTTHLDNIDIGSFVALVLLPQSLLLLVPVGAAWYLKLDMKKTFLWRTPRWQAMLGALFLGFGSFLIVQQLVAWQSHFWEFTPADKDPLKTAIQTLSKSGWGIALLIFLIGVTPGICEEHLFRGFLLQGLRTWKKWAALITVGVIFGAYHVPFFNQPVIMLMGIVLAFVAYETRSIWPGVLYHFTHNSLTAVVPAFLGAQESEHVAGEPLAGVPLQWLLPAIALFAVGLWLVRKGRPAVEVI